MHCLCECRLNWASWMLSGNSIWILNSLLGRPLPTGKFQSNRREELLRTEPHGSCECGDCSDIEYAGMAQNGCCMTAGPSPVISGGGGVSMGQDLDKGVVEDQNWSLHLLAHLGLLS